MWQSDEIDGSSEDDYLSVRATTLPTWADVDETETQDDAPAEVRLPFHPARRKQREEFDKRYRKSERAAWAEVARLQKEKAQESRFSWWFALVGWLLAASGWWLYATSHPGLPKAASLLQTMQSSSAQEVAAAMGEVNEFGTMLHVSPRWLTEVSSSSGSASAASGSGGDGHAEHSHSQDALLFLFLSIVVSVAILYITMFNLFHGLQHTVALFVIGTSYGWLYEVADLYEGTGVLGRSHKMWMDIDPHLLLVTMLPALLTADAMTIDTSIAFRVAKQCIYLAGPGVLVNACLVALFLWFYLPYNWSFMLSLVTGAILCATDPVAVVALLKELGASPTLTVQIQGESLLNDGTAIVLYTVAYDILKGEEYGVADIIIFLVKTAMLAWLLGMVIGFIFLEWIRFSSRKLEHHSSLIQTALTLCCAYWSFIMAEGVFGISGVLSCVAASLVLAHKMWPSVVDKESMHTIWHMFEYLGNTVIFFLAGCLTGTTMAHISGEDYLHLIVIYIVLVVVRGTLLFGSRPILRHLGTDKEAVPAADLLVMTWGGLRGAVGLSLAIQVNGDRASGQISEMDARRVLFYVSGVAALTLCVNATTCPFLVQVLGITQLPEAKHKILMILVQRLRHISNETPRSAIVTKTIASMLDDVQRHLAHHGRHHSAHVGGTNGSLDDLFPAEDVCGPSTSGSYSHHLAGAIVDRERSVATAKRLGRRWVEHVRRKQSGDRVDMDDSSDSDYEVSMGRGMTAKLTSSAGSAMRSVLTGTIRAVATSSSDLRKKFNTTASKSLTNVVPSKKDLIVDELGRKGSKGSRQSVGSRNSGRAGSKQSIGSRGQTISNGRLNEAGQLLDIKNLFKRFAREGHMEESSCLIHDLKMAKAGVTAIKFLNITRSEAPGALGGAWDIPKMPFVDQESDICKMMMEGSMDDQKAHDPALSRTFNEVFLKLVRKEYWKAIESGSFANPKDGELLLLSVTLGLSKTDSDLCDFTYIQQFVTTGSFVQESQARRNSLSMQAVGPLCVQRILSSVSFNVTMVIFLILSVVSVHVEEELLKTGEPLIGSQTFWLLAEIVFIGVFTLEFLLKFWNLRFKYFLDILNIFDFLLIIIGIAGIGIAAVVDESSGEDAKKYSHQARLIRAMRVFRALRLLRILRVFRFMEEVSKRCVVVKGVSSEVASVMQKVSLLRSFVQAHICAQKELVSIFCKDGKVAIPEVARCLVKSQTSAYTAITMSIRVEQSVDRKLMNEVKAVRESTDIAEHLEKFVLAAHENGVIGSKEAAQFLHPLHAHLERFYRRLRRTHKGLTQDKTQLAQVAARVAAGAGAISTRARSQGVPGFRASILPGSRSFQGGTRSSSASSNRSKRASADTVGELSDESTIKRVAVARVKSCPSVPVSSLFLDDGLMGASGETHVAASGEESPEDEEVKSAAGHSSMPGYISTETANSNDDASGADDIMDIPRALGEDDAETSGARHGSKLGASNSLSGEGHAFARERSASPAAWEERPGSPPDWERPASPAAWEERPASPPDWERPASPAAWEERPASPPVWERPASPEAWEERPASPPCSAPCSDCQPPDEPPATLLY